MKIGILSLVLGRNYGGILQQYALKKYLESQGHQVVILNRQPNESNFIKQTLREMLKAFGMKRFNTFPRKEPNLESFIQREFQVTAPASSSKAFKVLCRTENIDAIVYGSDQIWRCEFERHFGLDYFGVSTPVAIKQVAYAPSFGLDTWEYSTQETTQITKSFANFTAISSREESGVSLIKNYLHYDAALVCDPTILLTADDYSKIASKPLQSKPYCFIYWLGDKETMDEVVNNHLQEKGMDVISINLRTDYPLPSIEDWLSYLINAEYVITDSFHGTVFSLLFHKQFFIHCNKSGGFGRLETLLKRVGAGSKLLNPNIEIDYSVINDRVSEFRSQSQSFLNQALSQ